MLLYSEGGFMLSRNFRLQRAGDIEWLKSNYNFKNIAFSIDELIILDVSRGERNLERFCDHIKAIAEECFVPIAAGGGITTHDNARNILNSGADKLVINTELFKSPVFVKELVGTYGSQCIIASIDVKKEKDKIGIYIDNGSRGVGIGLSDDIEHIISLGIGEIYLNSMDNDGTGHGYVFDSLDQIKKTVNVPFVIAGGAGNWHHLLEGLRHPLVDAVATANLFNFIGKGFPNAREQLIINGIDLARWETTNYDQFNE